MLEIAVVNEAPALLVLRIGFVKIQRQLQKRPHGGGGVGHVLQKRLGGIGKELSRALEIVDTGCAPLFEIVRELLVR